MYLDPVVPSNNFDRFLPSISCFVLHFSHTWNKVTQCRVVCQFPVVGFDFVQRKSRFEKSRNNFDSMQLTLSRQGHFDYILPVAVLYKTVGLCKRITWHLRLISSLQVEENNFPSNTVSTLASAKEGGVGFEVAPLCSSLRNWDGCALLCCCHKEPPSFVSE